MRWVLAIGALMTASCASSPRPEPRPSPAGPPITGLRIAMVPKRCQPSGDVAALRDALLALRDPEDDFEVSVQLWVELRSQVAIRLRSSREAHASLFWIGPDDSVWLVFADEHLEGGVRYGTYSNVIIVHPLGLERQVLVVTPRPVRWPCSKAARAYLDKLRNLPAPFAVSRWSFSSKGVVPARRRR